MTITHSLTTEKFGIGECAVFTPVCSCGWRGRSEFAHNDSYTILQEQKDKHIAAQKKDQKS